MLRRKYPMERSGSEYYSEVVSMGQIEVARTGVVGAQETSLPDMDRGETQVAVHTCME